MDKSKIVSPGDKLGLSKTFHPGLNTSLYLENYVIANCVGLASLQMGQNLGLSYINIQTSNRKNVLPQNNDTVIGKVYKINHQLVYVEIKICNGVELTSPFFGIIRIKNIRSYSPDEVEVCRSFRPGDVVRAVVLCYVGNQKQSYLTTARSDLGVLIGLSLEGNRLKPLTAKKMKSVEGNEIEDRKVALTAK